MPDTPLLRRVLWAATALCLLSGLIAIPAVGGRDDDGLRTVAQQSSTTIAGDAGDAAEPSAETLPDASTPGSSPAGTTAPATATTRGGAGGQATTVPGATQTTSGPVEQLGAPKDPGATVPPKAGTYRYQNQASSDGQSRSSESTTKVEDRGRSGGEVRQLFSMRGGGFDSDSDVSWRSDGLYVLKSTFMFQQSRGECDWTPDIRQSALPLTKGMSWESEGSCTVSGLGPTPITITRKVTGKVIELRRVRIAGQVVDTWAIDTTERVEFSGNLIESTAVALFSPKHGLTVQAKGKASGSGGSGESSGDFSTELLNLDPQ